VKTHRVHGVKSKKLIQSNDESWKGYVKSTTPTTKEKLDPATVGKNYYIASDKEHELILKVGKAMHLYPILTILVVDTI
jgi:hypothetical protein